MTNKQRLVKILKYLKQEGGKTSPPNKLGLSPSQVDIIDNVFLSGKITVKKLSDSLNLKPPTISVSVKKLEHINVLKREPHEEDGRVALLRLTKKGFNLYNQIEKYRAAKVNTILNRLNPTEQNQMLILLEKALKDD